MKLSAGDRRFLRVPDPVGSLPWCSRPHADYFSGVEALRGKPVTLVASRPDYQKSGAVAWELQEVKDTGWYEHGSDTGWYVPESWIGELVSPRDGVEVVDID